MYHHPDGPGGGFHQWMSAGENDDSCIKCGVTTPDFGEGVISTHGPVPLICPGPDGAYNAHHFVGTEEELVCAYCTLRISDSMDDPMDWECRDDNHPPIPEGHPNYVAEEAAS